MTTPPSLESRLSDLLDENRRKRQILTILGAWAGGVVVIWAAALFLDLELAGGFHELLHPWLESWRLDNAVLLSLIAGSFLFIPVAWRELTLTRLLRRMTGALATARDEAARWEGHVHHVRGEVEQLRHALDAEQRLRQEAASHLARAEERNRVLSSQAIQWQEGHARAGNQTEFPNPWLLARCFTPGEGFLPQSMEMDGILQGHLRRLMGETESAAFEIITKVKEVDNRISGLMSYLEGASGADVGGSKESHEDREAIAALHNFVEEARKRRESEQARGRQVMAEISGMAQFVNLVRDISERTNVLSLNARIIASRAQEHGKQFAEVANEVRNLSNQVREAADRIDQGIAHSVSAIGALFQDQRAGGAENDVLTRAADNMVRMGEHYGKLLDHNEAVIHHLRAWNQQVSNLVMGVLGNIQFQDITRQQAEQVVKALLRRQEFVAQVMALAAKPHAHAEELPPFHVDQFLRDYVMEQQRAVHKQRTDGGHHQAATAMIELF